MDKDAEREMAELEVQQIQAEIEEKAVYRDLMRAE